MKVYELDNLCLIQENKHKIEKQLPKQNLKSIFFTQINNIIKSEDKKITLKEIEEELKKQNYLPDEIIGNYEIAQNVSEPILQTLRKIFLQDFVKIGLIKFISIIFLFTTPVLITNLTQSFEQESFMFYSGTVLISTILSAVTDTQYNYLIRILEFKSKSFLTQTIYNSLDTQSNLDLMNLINIDVNTIINFFISFHEFWSLILKLIIGMIILYIQIQEAVFVGLGVAVTLMIINFAVANQIGKFYSSGLIFKDLRMSAIKDFITNPKSIKFLKWERKWEEKILDIRQQEFQVISGSKWLDSLCVLFWSVTNTLISSITLYVYSQKNELENVFTIIFLFSLLINPLNSLPWTLSGMLQAKSSFLRINSFAISNTPLKEIIEEGIQIKNAILKWNKNDNFSLQIPSFQPSKLTFIGGKVSQGKTSFLLSLLNQMRIESGFFRINYQFSFVSQQNWLFQGSIKENILMQSEFDEEQYLQCLKDSNLLSDIQLFPEKDNFNVGPDGSKLSGGQKQRLCICRALYNLKDILLLDDIFSSLDPQVGDDIFNNLLKLQKPIIMTLNDNYLQRYQKYADQILIVNQGKLISDKEEINKYLQNLSEIVFFNNFQNNESQKVENPPELENYNKIQDSVDTQKSSSKSAYFYFQNLGKFNFIWILLSLALMQLSFNIYDIWLNSYINSFNSDDLSPIFIINDSFIITLLVLVIFDIIVKISRAVSFAYGNLEQAKSIFKVLLSKVIHAKAEFFDKEQSGQILIRFSDDQNVVDNRFPFELNLLCNNIFNFIGTFIVLITLEQKLLIPILISAIFFHRLQQLFRPTSLSLRRLDAETNSNLATTLFEQFKGISIINAFKKREEFRQIFLNNLKSSIQVQWCSRVLALWLQIRLQIVAIFIVFFILLFSIISIVYKLEIEKSTLQLLLYYSLTKISLFRDLIISLTTCEQELISYERQNQYINNTIEQDKLLKYNDTITFNNIKLKYSSGQQALKGINFEIKQGQRIAFCGRTGSGKSSILSVLFQLYEHQEGDLEVSGNTLFKWRQKIGVIPQTGFVFDGNLYDNLDSEDNIRIKELTDLDGEYQIDSKSISLGMRQLISFTRVILQDPDIICLDEATASVDKKIEDQIQEYLKNCGKTIITISHRLEALQDYDKIFYLEDGKILEEGTFQELIEIKGGFYRLRNC